MEINPQSKELRPLCTCCEELGEPCDHHRWETWDTTKAGQASSQGGSVSVLQDDIFICCQQTLKLPMYIT